MDSSCQRVVLYEESVITSPSWLNEPTTGDKIGLP